MATTRDGLGATSSLVGGPVQRRPQKREVGISTVRIAASKSGAPRTRPSRGLGWRSRIDHHPLAAQHREALEHADLRRAPLLALLIAFVAAIGGRLVGGEAFSRHSTRSTFPGRCTRCQSWRPTRSGRSCPPGACSSPTATSTSTTPDRESWSRPKFWLNCSTPTRSTSGIGSPAGYDTPARHADGIRLGYAIRWLELPSQPLAGSPHSDSVQKGTVAQTIPDERVCKGLGVTERYCRITVIGNTVLQW